MRMPPAQPAAVESTPGPQLRDIHLPPAPSWWPPAPGWWVLAVLALAALLAGAWWWQRRRRVRRQQQHILLELDRLVLRHRQSGDQAALVSGMHQLLRRVARRQDPLAAQQRGDAWRQTLARVPVDACTLEYLLALDRLIYQPSSSLDDAVTIEAMRQWLRLAVLPATWKPLSPERAHA